MSTRSCDVKFESTLKILCQLLNAEMPEVPDLPIMDRREAIKSTSQLYILYIKIVQNLNECYDQILQPQKRTTLRELIEGCIGRVLELKDELVQMEFRDIQFLDYLLPAFNMEPEDMILPTPRFFIEEASDEQIENRSLVEQTLNKLEHSEPKAKEEVEMPEISSLEDAVKLIQTHERARQDKNRFIELKEMKIKDEQQLKEITGQAKNKLEQEMSQDEAVTHIQTAWRGFKVRKCTKIEREDEMKLLRMVIPPPENEDFQAIQRDGEAQEVLEERRLKQPVYETNYTNALAHEHEYMQHDVVPEMTEKLEDDIREYFDAHLKEHNEFPTYPTEEEGGSFVFLPQEGYEIEIADAKEEKNKKEKKGDKKDKKKKPNPAEDGYILKPSKYLPAIASCMDKYKKWQEGNNIIERFKDPFRFDPEDYWISLNSEMQDDDAHDDNLIATILTEDYTRLTRKKIDEKMRTELQILTAALDKDLGKKPKKGKKGGKKGKGKGKKGGKKVGKKGKKEKDLTPDRTLESLIEELIQENILKTYEKVYLSDIIENYNYCAAFFQKDGEIDPDASIMDIKRILKEFCVLPMISPSIHAKGPYTKSILFAGPHGCGKQTFVRALCTEMGATLFDLTAENIAGKYPGKPGLDMLMHLILKVGKKLQPTVILIRDAEKTFLKKVPKTDETDPKRLKKNLPKFIKGIGADDRILLIGTITLPFSVDLKGLGQTYQKVIYLRHPDYGFRRILWFEMVTRQQGIITPQFDMTSICYVSDGYVLPQIKDVAQKVLTGRRIAYQGKIPLVIKEFTAQLYMHIPIYNEEHEAFRAWILKMPLGKKRVKMLKMEMEET